MQVKKPEKMCLTAEKSLFIVASMNISHIIGIIVISFALTASILLMIYSMKIIRRIEEKNISSLREIEQEFWGGR